MRLKELRKQKKLRQQDVADAINCSQAVYSRYENGEREPSKIVLNSLADFYNVSVDYILGRDQDVDVHPSSDNDVEIRFLARGGEHLSPERRKKVEALLASLMDLDDEALDQAGQVIDIYHKR